LEVNIPSQLIQSLNKMDHFDPVKFLAAHASENQIVSVHMNPGKSNRSEGGWPAEIKDPPFKIIDRVPWCADSFYLSERPAFTLDPFFHAGLYYVQEASGLFLEHALKRIADTNKNLKVLDLCAAPGGKSTLIQSIISTGSLLVSNEVIKTRVPVLSQNMIKWGYANGIVSNNDPAHFKKLPGYFDIILIDAPCSGSGLFRKNPEASNEWNPDLVHLCQLRQQRIVADAWDCLKENGYLIYSTCSYSKAENEDILDSVFQQFPCESIPLFPNPNWNIVETLSDKYGAHGYRFYPYNVSGEGFFLSVLKKKQEVVSPDVKVRTKHNLRKISSGIEHQIAKWMNDKSLSFISIGEAIHSIPENLVSDLEALQNHLYLKKAGIRLGKSGEKEWIPDHELALANFLNKDAERVDISKTDALHFLRGQAFESNVEGRGWRVVTYQNQRLGWLKMLEKRFNNYYPKSWRIRKQEIF
jgi:16S rRNA C967 or C1407 C5-methylase (RsmB/RsmF family)/NOL1/NOP2/fmu family ribosome biogenesis protein